MKSKPISELEEMVMNVIWELKQASVREVLAKISRKKPLAYTTVATILQRLYDKGLVSRKRGPVILYQPLVSKARYGHNVARSFVRRFFNSFGDVAIASFAESIGKLPRAKKDYLLKLLETHHENQ